MGGWRIQFLQPLTVFQCILIRLSLKLGFIQAKVIPLVLELVLLIILPFFLMVIIMTVYMIERIKIMTELIEAQVAWIGIIVKCRDNLE